MTSTSSKISSGPSGFRDRLAPRILGVAAILAWVSALAAICGRVIISPDRATNTARYLRAGHAWLDGAPLYIYTPNKGFVYSPFAAVCYAATTFLPGVLPNILWICVSVGLLLWGIWTMLECGPFREIPARFYPWVYLLIFPLSLGNIDSAQANPVVIGFIMLGVAAACRARWTLAAAAIAGAVYWKVYPLAVGMLLVLTAPKKFSWRLALALALGAFLPFLFQQSAYVADQYRLWYDTRISDNRLAYALDVAPLDLWFLLVRTLHLPLSSSIYRIIQLGAAAAIAGICLWGSLHRWSAERLYGALFCLVCVWMTLLGPASELHAYLLLAPAVVLSLADSYSRRESSARRALVAAAYILLLLAILRVGFIPKFKELWVLSLQPLAAVIFLLYTLFRYLLPAPEEARHE